MVPSLAAWMPRMSAKIRLGSALDAAELQIHLRFGDVGADCVYGGEVGVAHKHRPVRKRLARRVACW